MERCITQLEEGEKAREMTGRVNCISTNTPRAGWRALNDGADRRRAKRGAKGDKEGVEKKEPQDSKKKKI